MQLFNHLQDHSYLFAKPKGEKMKILKLVSALCLIAKVCGTFTRSYQGRACPGQLHTITCSGQAGGAGMSWQTEATTPTGIIPQAIGFIPPDNLIETFTSTSPDFSDVFTGEITVSFSPISPPGPPYTFNSEYSINTSVPTMLTCRNFTDDIGSVAIEFATPPSLPLNLRQLGQAASLNSVEATIGWSPPTDNGGRDDLTYTVSISPLAQLSATVINSTSVTVSADYNVNYTVSIMASNCAGNSNTRTINFRTSGCEVPSAPVNGTIGRTLSRTIGSTVAFQCITGFIPAQQILALCTDSLVWSPDPETFECLPETGVPVTEPFSTLMFTDLDLTLGVIVSSAISVVIGASLGVCGTYLFMRKKSNEMENKNIVRSDIVPTEVLVLPSESVPPPLPPLRQASPEYEEIPTERPESEMEANYAYPRRAEF